MLTLVLATLALLLTIRSFRLKPTRWRLTMLVLAFALALGVSLNTVTLS